ncbi:hypothetical protein B7P43_G08419 [Cryptotermes secundus]|uniref:DUF4817 domain-containing protein n=1 Tax=Cryptotermes secundus TaxID=105785 RepID=A0A2J7QNP5_9NEOP|nr:hypothetical protein B7P43_G08419 [Cryptotermes secundus]
MPSAPCEQKTAARMEERLFFEQRKAVLKWYWKYENIKEVRQWQNEFGTQPPTCRTIACIRDKFEADGTVHDVHKQRSSRGLMGLFFFEGTLNGQVYLNMLQTSIFPAI